MNVSTEKDPDRLRQMALILEAENKKLHQRLAQLTAELAAARGQDGSGQLVLELEQLKEQLAARNRALFGSRSERRRTRKDQSKDSAAREPQHGHGPREQPELPIVEQVHELDAADQICPDCGEHLPAWEDQFEEAEEVDVVEREFRVVVHKRQKYRCSCGHIDTALGPNKLIEGGRYSVDFAVGVAVDKYADHLPLERQVKRARRQGLHIDSQTLWDQLWALHNLLKPTYAALGDWVRSAPVVGADETTWRLMGNRSSVKWWVWALSRPDGIYYELAPSRDTPTAAHLLDNYSGVVMADGYAVYKKLYTERAQMAARDGPPSFLLASCWAHVRRKFYEAEPNYPEAGVVLDLIGELYDIEAEAQAAGAQDPLSHLAAVRAERSTDIVRRIRIELSKLRALPKSSLGKAITYAYNIWPGLERFLADPRIPLDNNRTERGMRAVVLGRRNHHGSRSKRGTKVAALFYSLIESARMSGLEPAAYLAEATRRAIKDPNAVTLPKDLLPEASCRTETAVTASEQAAA